MLKVLVDGGYNGKPFESFVRTAIGAEAEAAKRGERHTFAVIPKRCVAERGISWLRKRHRLRKNCGRKRITSPAMIRLAFISLLIKRS